MTFPSQLHTPTSRDAEDTPRTRRPARRANAEAHVEGRVSAGSTAYPRLSNRGDRRLQPG
ncbi:hypothetical protein [Halonotius roseus]|uniref:Uncharacterized protein n=1 Tax=Halonotius roseus TaxID=2511997 RepID=A0A544QQW0_9EURY|nr:hypothetical protein [Halonotius roseus]TQQ81835.1 hypothetical protein EWF95_02555 [Halonotius roseus]